MRLKKFGALAIAVFALGAVLASSASATATTGLASWKINGKAITTHAVTCRIGEHEGASRFTLSTSLLGQSITLTATGVNCPESRIFNEGGAAKDEGFIEFTGVTVDEPAKCTVPNGTVKTNLLSTELYMEGTKVYDRFVPKTGTVFVELTLSGKECAAAGTYPVEGEVFGEAAFETGVERAEQPLTFSGAINATAGGSLTFFGEPASLTGRAINEVGGGAVFGAA